MCYFYEDLRFKFSFYMRSCMRDKNLFIHNELCLETAGMLVKFKTDNFSC